jgi:Ca-activated chloride channel homolog
MSTAMGASADGNPGGPDSLPASDRTQGSVNGSARRSELNLKLRWMPRLDRPVVLTIVFAVVITAMAGALHQLTSSSGCTELVVASSQEKSTLMQEAAAAFNATRPVVGGRCATVTVEQVVSGAAEQALADGWKGQVLARPDVWSPAATTWLDLLDQQLGDKPLFVLGTANSLMKSPLVIAMPKPMAIALGWPQQPVGWQTIFKLAQDPRGWADYGHPDWGLFRLGKTNPDLSTSGLNALISTYYAASHKSFNLTLSDLERPEVKGFVKEVESSVAHYGDTATTFLGNLRRAGQNGSAPYVSAVAVEEKEVWNYNVGNVTGDPSQQSGSVIPVPLLAAIYPSDGTLLADHPYQLLNWATPDKKAAADRFRDYLLSTTSQKMFQAAGFRDSQGAGGPDAISAVNNLNPEPPYLVELPAPKVIAAIQASWTALRKPARVLIAIDVSASVGAGPLAAIKSSLVDTLGKLSAGDQVGLSQAPGAAGPFDELVPVSALTPAQLSEIDAKIEGLKLTAGQASLVDLVRSSVDELRAAYDPGRIDAVVLLSPGTGPPSAEFQTLLQELRDQPSNESVPIFTVSYGDHPDTSGNLGEIAGNSGASSYNAASPGSFGDLMIQVLSNF